MFVVAVVDCSVSVCFGFLGVCWNTSLFCLILVWFLGGGGGGVLEHNFSLNRSKFKFACHTMGLIFPFVFCLLLFWTDCTEKKHRDASGRVI